VAGITFTVDRTQIKAGECVNFYWKVENVQEVYFYAEGEDWRDNGVTGEGTRQECPPVTWAYYLRVVKLDGSVETPKITIYVEPVAEAPAIKRFTVDPSGQIVLGQCVNIQWKVTGSIETVALTANDTTIWEPAPSSGSTQHCPDAADAVVYGILAVGPGGSSRGSHTINVVDSATATPAPTQPPTKPVIVAFSVSPEEIRAGECVVVRWEVGGGAVYVQVIRNGDVVIDDADFVGQGTDCLTTAGSYTYHLEAWNVETERVSTEVTITVVAPE
jgi:hypothetical protein